LGALSIFFASIPQVKGTSDSKAEMRGLVEGRVDVGPRFFLSLLKWLSGHVQALAEPVKGQLGPCPLLGLRKKIQDYKLMASE
jgi:hypothetical protein